MLSKCSMKGGGEHNECLKTPKHMQEENKYALDGHEI